VTVHRGDVVLCDLNPVMGTEQAGIRPCLVLQTDQANLVSPHTIIAPFTTRIRQTLLPCHVFVPAGEGSLKEDSVLLCEQIRVIDGRRVIRGLGTISEELMSSVAEALRRILDL
jgi:mRNA interferase MazF